jgi:hypothetical protein
MESVARQANGNKLISYRMTAHGAKLPLMAYPKAMAPWQLMPDMMMSD